MITQRRGTAGVQNGCNFLPIKFEPFLFLCRFCFRLTECGWVRRAGCSHTSRRDFSPRPPSCPSISATSTLDTDPSNSHHPNTSTSRHSTTTVTSNRRRRLSCQGNSFFYPADFDGIALQFTLWTHLIRCRPEKLELIRSQSVIVNPCILCFDSAATVALKPCDHAGFCAECAKQVWPSTH